MTALINGTDDPYLVKLLGKEMANEITDAAEFKKLLDGFDEMAGEPYAPGDGQPPYDDGVLMVLGEWDAPSPSVIPDTPKPKGSPLHRWRSLPRTVDGGASDKALHDKTPNIDKPVAPQLKGRGGAISIPLPLNISSISTQIIPLAKLGAVQEPRRDCSLSPSRGKHEPSPRSSHCHDLHPRARQRPLHSYSASSPGAPSTLRKSSSESRPF